MNHELAQIKIEKNAVEKNIQQIIFENKSFEYRTGSTQSLKSINCVQPLIK